MSNGRDSQKRQQQPTTTTTTTATPSTANNNNNSNLQSNPLSIPSVFFQNNTINHGNLQQNGSTLQNESMSFNLGNNRKNGTIELDMPSPLKQYNASPRKIKLHSD